MCSTKELLYKELNHLKHVLSHLTNIRNRLFYTKVKLDPPASFSSTQNDYPDTHTHTCLPIQR